MNPIAKRSVAALSTAAVVVLAILYAPSTWFVPAFIVLIALATLEYALLLRRKVSLLSVKGLVGLLLGFAVLAGGLSALPAAARAHGNLMMLYLVAIVKISDMGGFAFGLGSKKIFGENHKLCPSISPGKSWEGLLGSVIGSLLMSAAFLPITKFGVGKALAFGLCAALLGTAGDLVESKFKRWVGVKDSSTFMPAGMGGLLDMFDSLLFAPPLLLLFV